MGHVGARDDGRIIPAYAGSTYSAPIGYDGRKDHPRVCGEHKGQGRWQRRGWGSSPRMRGALHSALRVLAHAGIIPAYAGSTQNPANRARYRRDHPRVCGEHSDSQSPLWRSAGSSPRMRGAR